MTTELRKRQSIGEMLDTERGNVMHKSKLSVHDRRKVRQAERAFHVSLQENDAELSTIESHTFQDKTMELDQLYAKGVKYPREANLDALNLNQFSKVMTKQHKALASNDLSKFDLSELIQAARATYVSNSDEEFDWGNLGQDVAGCFQSAVSHTIILGSMDTQIKAPKARKARVVAPDEKHLKETAPADFKDFQQNRVNAQTRRLRKVGDVLKQYQKTHPSNPYVCLFDLCVHPTSFSQTVENLFDLSFQVKNCDAMVILLEGVPHVTGFADDEVIESSSQSQSQHAQDVLLQHATPVQCISSLTPKQWRQIVSQYDLTQAPLVGDRDLAMGE